MPAVDNQLRFRLPRQVHAALGQRDDGVGLKATRNVRGIPVYMPPRIPPWWFVFVLTTPFSR